MMQFLGRFDAVSSTGIKQMVYNVLPAEDDAMAEQPLDHSAAEWLEIIEQVFDKSAIAFAKKCIALDIPKPSAVGYELVGINEEVIGEAEFAWFLLKIAFLTPEQIESEEAFINGGWKVIKVDDEITPSFFKEVE